MSYRRSQIITFTPTGSWVSNTTYSGWYVVDGDMLHITYKLVLTGAPTAANLTLNLPAGFNVRLIGGSEEAESFLSNGSIGDPSVAYRAGLIAMYGNATSIGVSMLDAAANTINQVNATNPQTFGTGDSVHLHVSLPITRV